MKPDRWRGWIPIRVFRAEGSYQVDWCYMGDTRFADPFFDQTIERCLRHPFNLAFRRQTPIEALAELQALAPGIPPAGFIFHLSRCGSTLVCQMLAALSQHTVISEASVIDSILRARQGTAAITDEQRIGWLRGLIGALGRLPREVESRLFVKFDSWQAVDLPVIRRAFPDVPWVFLYRDPVEVLVSHYREPGAQMVPGLMDPGWMGMGLDEAGRTPRDQYTADALAAICRAALANGEGGRYINYRDLPAALYHEIVPHFGLMLGRADLERMALAAQFDAKAPGLPFEADSETKQRAATPEIRALARGLAPQYEALERLAHRVERTGLGVAQEEELAWQNI